MSAPQTARERFEAWWGVYGPEPGEAWINKHAASKAWKAAERSAIERAAKVAEAHKGSAAKKRLERGLKLSKMSTAAMEEVMAEERGEDIASEIITTAIRSLLT